MLSLCGLFLSPQSPPPPSATWMCRETSRPRCQPVTVALQKQRPKQSGKSTGSRSRNPIMGVRNNSRALESGSGSTARSASSPRPRPRRRTRQSPLPSNNYCILVFLRRPDRSRPSLFGCCSSSVLSSQSSATRPTRHAYSVLCTGETLKSALLTAWHIHISRHSPVGAFIPHSCR